MATKRPPDKRTRWPGVVARHRRLPRAAGKRCRCEPGYVARVWDPTRRRPISSPTYRTPQKLSAGSGTCAPRSRTARRIRTQHQRQRSRRSVPRAIKDGTALSKKGKPYKAQARKTIENALNGRIARELGGEPLDDVGRGQVQTMIDEMVTERLSGSRVRNVLNALRSLYTTRSRASSAEVSPITNIVLPAVGEKPRERIATPSEFSRSGRRAQTGGHGAVRVGRLRDRAQPGGPQSRVAGGRLDGRHAVSRRRGGLRQVRRSASGHSR